MSSILGRSLPFEVKVGMRLYSDMSHIDKFGLNPTITAASDPEDIWESGGTYTYDSGADIVSIASSSDLDLQVIKVTGLDVDGYEVVQEITLQGTTRVALDTALWRVYRLENDGDDGDDINGTVFCYTGTGTVPAIGDTEVRAVIIGDQNQTQMAIYTIPKGKVGFLKRGEIGMEYEGSVGTGTNYARCTYKSRRYGKIFKVKKTITLINNANSLFQDKRSFPDILPSLTDIKLTVQEVSEDMGAWATFDILLVDEDSFSQSFLDEIGQVQ